MAITTELIEHECVQMIHCCSCGAEWEELWVGVALGSAASALQVGHLCPRCLNQSPEQVAHHFRSFSRTLEARVHHLRQQLQSGDGMTVSDANYRVACLLEETRLRSLQLAGNLIQAAALQARSAQLVNELKRFFRHREKRAKSANVNTLRIPLPKPQRTMSLLSRRSRKSRTRPSCSSFYPSFSLRRIIGRSPWPT